MNPIYLVIVIIILLVIVEILALSLRLTGLSREKARFQVISIITGTGFTTSESELITQHKTRRKIAASLMLISYVGQATIIGLGLGLITRVFKPEDIGVSIAVALGAIFILHIIPKNRWLMIKVEKIIRKAVKKNIVINKGRTVEEVLKLGEGFGVVEFLIDNKSPLVGVTLKNSGLKAKEIQVLNVERGDYIEKFPKWSLKFKEGDKVVVYGNIENISNIATERIHKSWRFT